VSAPTRCKKCKHRRGLRVLSYRKTAGNPDNPLVVVRQHKKHCDCECHQ
jgi:hypothetical protein